jgi:hypothetical protein
MKDKKAEILKALLQQAKGVYTFKENNLLHFTVNSRRMRIISNLALQNDEVIKLINEEQHDLIKKYIDSDEKLENHYRNYDDFLNELTYKSYFQAFEEFLHDTFEILYTLYPNFLKKDKLELDFSSVFEQEEIGTIRSKIIGKKVKSIIQSNNIKVILHKFKTIFGFEIKLKKKNLDRIYIASKIRNILTHNNGIVNEIFIADMEAENLKSDYENGDNITKNLYDEIKKIDNLLVDVSESICEQILDKAKHLEEYSKNIT